MKYQDWNNDLFVRSIPKDKRIISTLEIIDKYLRFRNIIQDDLQKAVIVNAIVDEAFYMPYLKFYTVRWSLHKYTDVNLHNISAAIILDMIKKGYSSKEQKDIMNQWIKDQEKATNLLPDQNQETIEEKNRQARLSDFEKCVDHVNNNQVDFNKGCWKNGIQYLIKDIKLILTKEEIERYNDIAMNQVYGIYKAMQTDINASREVRQRAMIVSSDLLDKKITDEEIRNEVIALRQKLVLKDYIESMLVK